MNGQKIVFNNEFNLYQYFSDVSLKREPNLEKRIISYQDKHLTCSQLNEYAIKISQLLWEAEIRQSNATICVHLNPDELTIPTLLAIHRLSCAYLPIDPLMPTQTIQHILEDAKPKAFLTNLTNLTHLSSLDKTIQQLGIKVLNLNRENLEKISDFPPSLLPRVNYDPCSNACLIYTSGSTGLPKGVRLSHRSIMNRLNWQWHTFKLSEINDRGVFKTSLSFVDHISEIFAFTLKCLPILVLDQVDVKNPERLISLLFDFGVSYFVLVPSLLKTILFFVQINSLQSQLEFIKTWICSGETLDCRLIELFFEVNKSGSALCNIYGSTEVTADVTFVKFETKEHARKLIDGENNVPIGVPLANCGLVLVNENGEKIKQEQEIGELYAQGECVANGYVNSVNETKFVELDGVFSFKTGDFGYIKNQMIYFAGRVDSQFKINGKKVSLSDLTNQAMSRIPKMEAFIPLVFDADLSGNKVIIAYYKADLAEIELKNELKQVCFDYMLPSRFIRLEERVPLLYSGKVDKQALIRKFKADQNRWSQVSPQVADLSKVSQRLIQVISEVTGIRVSGETSENWKDFSLTEYGVNSLNVIEIFLTLKQSDEVISLSFDQFLACRTLAELIEKLNRSTSQVPMTSSFLHIEHTRFKAIWLKNKPLRFSKKLLKMIGDTYPSKSPVTTGFATKQQQFDNYYCLMRFAHVHGQYSFLVYDKVSKKCVGGAYAFDTKDLERFEFKKHKLDTNFCEYLHAVLAKIEKPHMNELRSEGRRILESYMIAVSEKMTIGENVSVVDFIEDRIVQAANENRFDAVFTLNTNHVTRDVCVKSKGYVLKEEVSVNKVEIDGKCLFRDYSDQVTVSVCVKYLNK